MKHIKNVFLSAIHQHAGKTTIALGLYKLFVEHGIKTSFIKPIGQKYVMVHHQAIDKDSYLINAVYHCGRHLKEMSPVTIGRGFTEKYIFHPSNKKLRQQIMESFNSLSLRKNAMIVEGTGHAGVGSVIDFSNADVASMLKSKVIIISEGGIGKSIDEIMLNKALFDLHEVEILGVIINKVIPEKYEKIEKHLRQGLKNKGLRLLGVIPHNPVLSSPTVFQIMQQLNLRLICGEKNIRTRVKNTIIAAMEPHNMIAYIEDHTLVVTSGDRIDNILVSISSHLLSRGKKFNVAGIILTGGMLPSARIIDLLWKSEIPVLLSEDDTYTVAANIKSLICKIENTDKDKIMEAVALVKKHVDAKMILDNL
ncbi:MAG: AAA family ATPase [Candidatus Omnitrophota bacterium]